MSKAKEWVQRPQYRSRVETDRKKEARKDPEWTIWIDQLKDPSFADTLRKYED